MNKSIRHLLCAFLIYSGANAQDAESYGRLMKLPIKKETRKNGDVFLQGDFTEVLTGQKDKKSLSRETRERIDNTNLPNPSVATVKKYLREAAREFNVPFPILDAIAKTYNNYAMIGPSEYGAYGIMGLVENKTNSAIAEASRLTGIKADDIKANPRENIRAAAALLSSYAGKDKNPDNVLEWFDAVKQLSGLNDEETREMQAIDYYKTLNEGRSSITLWKENAEVEGLNSIEISKLIQEYNDKIEQQSNSHRGATGGTVDYSGAIASFTDCNFSSRNGRDIDTWVNHYLATGSLAGAISWFRQCRGNNGSSAHFIVGLNGKVYQVVKVASKAWHAGPTQGGGYPNNERSIGVEHEVFTTTPGSWNNATLLKASTDLARYFCNLYSIPKTRSLPGIRGHKEMPGTSTDCPYTINWTTWMNLLNSGGTTPTNNIPVLNTPAAGATVASPVNLSWSTSVSGSSCRIQISKVNTGWTAANGFTTESAPTANVPVNYSTAGLLNYTWPNPGTTTANLPVAGNTYYWTVRSYSPSTGTSSYSPVRSFRIASAGASGRLMNNAGFTVYSDAARKEISINFSAAAQ
ncbi:MAG TPA: peptidoglycan recognition family protein, partial [Flavobacterium sp.]|nr:peptidoglycan recognition family protein [Flavobacterium sp.]